MKIDERLLGQVVRVLLEVEWDTIQGRKLEFFGKLGNDGERWEVGDDIGVDDPQTVFFTEEDIESQSFLTKTIILKDSESVGFLLADEKPQFKPI